MSSGDVELYAAIDGACQCIGLVSLAVDFATQARALVMIHASAALAIVQRRGLAKVRHIDVQCPCVQERMHHGDLAVLKAPGKHNPADMLAKRLGADDLRKHVEKFGFEMRRDRSGKSLKIGVVETERDWSLDKR